MVSVAASALDAAPLRSAAELIAAYDTHVDTVMRSARVCGSRGVAAHVASWTAFQTRQCGCADPPRPG